MDEITPETMAAELRRLASERNDHFRRYERAGTARKVASAEALSANYAQEAALWTLIHHAGRGLGFEVQELLFAGAAAALLLANQRVKFWNESALRLATEAQRIAQQTAQVFTSGMEYEPGRGVVRVKMTDTGELACDGDL